MISNQLLKNMKMPKIQYESWYNASFWKAE